MNCIRRSCQSALSTPQSIHPFSNGSRRAFSRNSACQRRALPTFLEPSTPELASLLTALNSKVLLPEHLTPEQQKLVYRQENRARLEAEPIEITLGDVTLPLEHIDRNRDIPDRWRTVKGIVEGSKTLDDWKNVIRMMEGFRNASIQLKPQWQKKIVRSLNQAGMQHLVLKALQQPRETGLRLRDPTVAHHVFRGIHEKAAGAGWAEEETKKALSLAEQVIELLEDKEHLGGAQPVPGDLRSSPFVIAIPLEMAAVRAKKHTAGQDADRKVAKYASRLMNSLHQDNFLSSTLPQEFQFLNPPRDFPTKRDHLLATIHLKRSIFQLVPLLSALKTALDVLGQDMPRTQEAQQLVNDIQKALKQGKSFIQKNKNSKNYDGSALKAIEDVEKL
ncbi:hypothetical protein CC78DRAFT_529171 [Lojkania enalia]|uniref:Uncharacterized protein n=1 Tax=Lojkania enalia TaxID=147567 RepID=A0A9P4NA29_9PLEO|nr:hypothetical protein CC78DRAFT_529171 [Didymosphaeria enalia]